MMTTRKGPTPIDEPRPFEAHELFFSITDPHGKILAGNSVFTRVSAHSAQALQGAPHSIIRHPDMPRVVFKILWEHIEAGKSIVAYVKNLAADGRYYWVVASVLPVAEGYLSVRFKPSSSLRAVVDSLYSDLRAIEKQVEDNDAGKVEAIDASRLHLEKTLHSLGYADYGAFMHAMIATELVEWNKGRRHLTLDARAPSYLQRMAGACQRSLSVLDEIFVELARFGDLNQSLGAKRANILALAESLQLGSNNTYVASRRLSQGGAGIAVVAATMERQAMQLADLVRELSTSVEEARRSLADVAYRVCVAKVQLEMGLAFLEELAIQGGASAALTVGRIEQSLATLVHSLDLGVSQAFEVLGDVNRALNGTRLRLEDLNELLRGLEMSNIRGRIEATSSNSPTIIKHLGDVAALAAESAEAIRAFAGIVHSSLLITQKPTSKEHLVRGDTADLVRALAEKSPEAAIHA